MISPQARMCARLYRLNVPIREIARRMGKDEDWVNMTLNDPEVVEAIGDETVTYDEGEELLRPEEIEHLIDTIKPYALKGLLQVFKNPKTPPSTIVKASELVMQFDATLKKLKQQGDQHQIIELHMDHRSAEILERIHREFNDEDLDRLMERETSILPDQAYDN